MTHTQILAQGWGSSGGKECDSTDVLPGKFGRITKGRDYFIWSKGWTKGLRHSNQRWTYARPQHVASDRKEEGRGCLGVRQALGSTVNLWCGLNAARFPRGRAEKSWPL